VWTDGGERVVTDVSADYVARTRPVGWERFRVPVGRSTPGIDPHIDAWIMRPQDFDPKRTYPVILNVHGGPHTQYGETFFDEFQAQAAAGFVVIAGNPRGSSGREEAWGQAIMGPKHPVRPGTGWGSVDFEDVVSILDTALDRFAFCDRGRVGMQGGSYGGYMATLLAAKHGGRLRAVCSERAVNNLLTEEWSSDIGTMFRVEHGPDPVRDPDEYLRMSPSVTAADIDVPVLIVHSENDLRCPISQAEELFVTLRLLGKEVVFYRFPAETHELSRSGSPVHRRQRFEIILDWFAAKLASF
jgi:dipeptidyl aminopeptidase/acylaminoacyl peptidase